MAREAKDEESERISACIREKMGEGWEQDRAVAACLNMERQWDLKAGRHDYMIKSVEFKSDSVNMEDRTFEGYASTWDLDQVGDVITQGAFSKSIAERFPKGDIKILWQHAEPIGMPMIMREDEKGLFVKGKITDTALGIDALKLMRDGVVNKMSIGFSLVAGKTEYNKDGVRVIREVKLWEFSPVTFPANEAAIITAVKHLGGLMSQSQLNAALGVHEPPNGTPEAKPHKASTDPEVIQSIASFRDEIKRRFSNG